MAMQTALDPHPSLDACALVRDLLRRGGYRVQLERAGAGTCLAPLT
jgi:hypothetical protein